MPAAPYGMTPKRPTSCSAPVRSLSALTTTWTALPSAAGWKSLTLTTRRVDLFEGAAAVSSGEAVLAVIVAGLPTAAIERSFSAAHGIRNGHQTATSPLVTPNILARPINTHFMWGQVPRTTTSTLLAVAVPTSPAPPVATGRICNLMRPVRGGIAP
jgi:hypothetical protein